MMSVLRLVFMLLLLVPLVAFAQPAKAMSEGEAANIVATADKAVQNTLAELEAANNSGDTERISMALQALDLAVANYDVASSELARIQAGEPGDDGALTACFLVADKLNSYSGFMAADNVAAARTAFTEAQGHASTLPPDSGNIPAGLADQRSRIIAAAARAISILGPGSGAGSKSGSKRLGLNTQVGSEI